MRILIVNKFLYPNGGSETYIFKIGQELAGMGHEVQYFGMEHEGRIVGNRAGIYTKPVDFHGGSGLAKLSMPFKILYSKEAKEDMKKVLRDFHPDVVHLNNINFQLTPSVIEAVREFETEQKGRVKIIYTAHDAQWVCPNHLLRIPSTGEICTRCIDGDYTNCVKYRCIHNSRLRSILGEKEAELYRKRGTYRLVDTIISPSRFLADILAHNEQLRGRITVLHNFYDGAGEPAQAELHQTEKEKMDLPPAGYVLYFGRYTKEKGVATLLEVCRRLPDIPFVFAGKGDLEAEVNAAAEAGGMPEDERRQSIDCGQGIERGSSAAEGADACVKAGRDTRTTKAACWRHVRNAGFQSADGIRELIRGAAFVVFPSEWLENGPFAVIESIMNGTPVVGSRLGGTPELIAEGETGRLFEAGNVAELEEIVRSLYYNQEELAQLREGCRKTMRGEGSIRFHTLHEYCTKLEEIYRE